MPFIYSKINIALLFWLHNVNIHNISTGFDDVTCLSNRSISGTFATWHHCKSKQRPLLCDQSGPWDLRCQQRILVSMCLRQIDIHSLLWLDYVIINTWYIGFDRKPILCTDSNSGSKSGCMNMHQDLSLGGVMIVVAWGGRSPTRNYCVNVFTPNWHSFLAVTWLCHH